MHFNIFRRSRKGETSLFLDFWELRKTLFFDWMRRQRRSWRHGHWRLSSDGLPPPMYSPLTLETIKTNTTACRQLRASTSVPSLPATLTSSWREGKGRRGLEKMETRKKRWRSRSSAPAVQLRFMVCLKLWKKLSPIHWHTPASLGTQDVSTFLYIWSILLFSIFILNLIFSVVSLFLSFFQPKRLISMVTPPRKSPLLQMDIRTEDLIPG